MYQCISVATKFIYDAVGFAIDDFIAKQNI